MSGLPKPDKTGGIERPESTFSVVTIKETNGSIRWEWYLVNDFVHKRYDKSPLCLAPILIPFLTDKNEFVSCPQCKEKIRES